MTKTEENIESQVRRAFEALEPKREFKGCKILQITPVVIVRVFSHAQGKPQLRPVPYQVFEFDTNRMALNLLTGTDAAAYRIGNYK